MRLTRLFTVRIRIVRKEIIDTVYVIMYDQHSNAPAHLEKKCSLGSWIISYVLGCLDIFLISNIQNIGINRLFLLHLSFNFTICPIFICEFIFLLIVFHIPLCNVRQPYKGCPLTCFLAEITRNETVWRMRTNNVKRVY